MYDIKQKPDNGEEEEIVKLHKMEINNNKDMIKKGALLLPIQTYIRIKGESEVKERVKINQVQNEEAVIKNQNYVKNVIQSGDTLENILKTE